VQTDGPTIKRKGMAKILQASTNQQALKRIYDQNLFDREINKHFG
jgi:hypothetical protein